MLYCDIHEFRKACAKGLDEMLLEGHIRPISIRYEKRPQMAYTDDVSNYEHCVCQLSHVLFPTHRHVLIKNCELSRPRSKASNESNSVEVWDKNDTDTFY